jgi:hypothetical protein
MHSLDIQQRWRMPNLDKWVIGRWMLGFVPQPNALISQRKRD